MTHSYLRAMSPIHLVYLRNMGVKSSMSIVSLVQAESLHLSYPASYIEVHHGIRKLVGTYCLSRIRKCWNASQFPGAANAQTSQRFHLEKH